MTKSSKVAAPRAGKRDAALYLPTAPRVLTEAHRRRTIGERSDVLGRLLTTKGMERPWREIAKRVDRSPDIARKTYFRLWMQIRTALELSKQDPITSEVERERYEGIVVQTVDLIDRVCSMGEGLSQFVETLDELAQVAATLAEHAGAKHRTVQRRTLDYGVTHFIRVMADWFRETLGGSMEGTIAGIATVVLEKPLTSERVKQALRHHNKGGA